MHRLLTTWTTLVALLGMLLVAGDANAGAPPPVATLKVDAAAFWLGTSKLALAESPLPPCSPIDAPCTDFAIDVAGGGARLRVAGDTPGQDGDIAVTLFDASGTEIDGNSGPYSTEVYAPKPKAGRWYARVTAMPVDKFRMRAKLERALPTRAKSDAMLLPNLQLIPPYELTFDSPLAPTDGRDPIGCKPYEQIEYAAKRCLRFSLGPQNVGEGPLMLRFDVDPVTGRLGRGPVTQLVLRADGKIVERAGGSSVWHKTHAHYHHNGFGSLELLKVLDPAKGTMTAAGGGPKQGFCMLDYLLPNWTKFDNDPPGATRQDCAPVSADGKVQLGLGVGWGDIYVYTLDGNYVEFGENTDGRYVIRSIADAFNDVLESDESDNAGYAYIEVKGNAVTVLERGRGMGPWDPHKVLANDILPANAP